MGTDSHPVALITGGSRGIGATTAMALAKRGYDIAITYRNKMNRAKEVVTELMNHGIEAIATGCDITHQEEIDQLFTMLKNWRGHLDLLVLNASGGLEKDLVAADPDYPMHINRDAQIALLDAALPLMPAGSVVLFVTSHWAHLYGQVIDLPAYAPVAESKYAGEQALRARQHQLEEHDIRLIVVTGDLIEGTITPLLLERAAPGLAEGRRHSVGQLPTAIEMGEGIAAAATNQALKSGTTIVIGGSLESLPRHD